ncbi:N-acetylmuramoyl-L-alanine amidase [Clostridium sp.]|uniref:N-acetylmuramoyl-L-alanine amidase n=1 Tax=Clostridium sp. TaxID=1506 RepID=UPI002FCA4C57
MSNAMIETLDKLRLAIDIGHNVKFDSGAVGIKKEDSLNFEVGSKLMNKCREVGIKVIDCTPKNPTSHKDSLSKRVIIANEGNTDYFISIHHNACPGGYGTEILCYPEERAENFANKVLSEIVKLGFRNRGVKHRADLYVLRKTEMPAILIECAFCDSEIDMKGYNPENMAEAIFRDICKALNLDCEINVENSKGDFLSGDSKDSNSSGAENKGETFYGLTQI